jgi:hypothetical protein
MHHALQGNPPEHPIALQIAAMVPRYKWTRTWITRILNKRVSWRSSLASACARLIDRVLCSRAG